MFSQIAVLIPLLSGRRRQAALPRVRHHAGGIDPDLGGRVADVDADDVRKALRHTPPEKRGRFTAGVVTSRRVIARYGRMLNWVLDRQGPTLIVAS
jgi:hypothetical protein